MEEFILQLNIEPLEEGGFLATSDDFPDLLAQGRTVAEAMEIAQDVARKLIDSYVEHGDPMPERMAAAISRGLSSAKVAVPVAVPAGAA